MAPCVTCMSVSISVTRRSLLKPRLWVYQSQGNDVTFNYIILSGRIHARKIICHIL